nr:hypothetical protein [Sphingobacterium phlebotomi]
MLSLIQHSPIKPFGMFSTRKSFANLEKERNGDLTIPENKIMLAFYLASPEVENDRYALNVFHGMRRAKKEGRYMGTAPLGYVNKISEDKKKYIAPHDFEAPLLKWAFEQIASNNFNTEQIWRKVREKVGSVKIIFG